jgi:hypothetical protein
LDDGLKLGEGRMVSAVEGATFDELPQSFDQVQARKTRTVQGSGTRILDALPPVPRRGVNEVI